MKEKYFINLFCFFMIKILLHAYIFYVSLQPILIDPTIQFIIVLSLFSIYSLFPFCRDFKFAKKYIVLISRSMSEKE
jgi:hypothetical protein